MAYKIEVAEEVGDYIDYLLEYLYAEWGEEVMNDFVESYFQATSILSIYPYSGNLVQNQKGLRKILVTKHNALYYKVKDKTVLLYFMSDTRRKSQY